MAIVGYDPATGRPIVQVEPEAQALNDQLALYQARGWVPKGHQNQLIEAYYDPRLKRIIYPRGRPKGFQANDAFQAQKKQEAMQKWGAQAFQQAESAPPDYGRHVTGTWGLRDTMRADFLAEHGGLDPNRFAPTSGRQPTYPSLQQLQARGLLPGTMAQLQGNFTPEPGNTGGPGPGPVPGGTQTNPGSQLTPIPWLGSGGIYNDSMLEPNINASSEGQRTYRPIRSRERSAYGPANSSMPAMRSPSTPAGTGARRPPTVNQMPKLQANDWRARMVNPTMRQQDPTRARGLLPANRATAQPVIRY